MADVNDEVFEPSGSINVRNFYKQPNNYKLS